MFGLLAAPGGFSVTISPESQTINAGAAATYTLTLTPSGGFNGTVSLSCSGAPRAATCSISPSSITLDGTNPATATVTVNTTARSSVVPGRWPQIKVPGTNAGDGLRWVLVSLAFAALVSLVAAGRRAWPRMLGPLGGAILILVLLWIACGGGGRTVPDPGTPPGSYTITITAVSVGLNHNVTTSLTVQ